MQVTLKAARVNKGYTQKMAAKALNIGVDTLVKYEKAKTFPDVPTIKRIEELYEVTYGDIIFLPSDNG